MKQKAVGLDRAQLGQSGMGNMAANAGVSASVVGQGVQQFAGKSAWSDLADGLSVLTKGVGALEAAQQEAVARSAHVADAERKRLEAEQKKLKEEEDARLGQAVVAQKALAGENLRLLAPESGASPAFQKGFRSAQAGIIQTQLTEQYQKDYDTFFSDPKLALTKSPEQFDREWAQSNGISELGKDPYLAEAAVNVMFNRGTSERHARTKLKQDELRLKVAHETWRNDMFGKVTGTKDSVPDLWELEARAKKLNVPEGVRYSLMLDAVNSSISKENFQAYRSLDVKGPDGLTMRQQIQRSGDNGAISALANVDKQFDNYGKEARKRAEEDALTARMVNRDDRRQTRPHELFNEDGTLNHDVINEPLLDPSLTPTQKADEVEKNKKAAQKYLEMRINGQAVSEGQSTVAGVKPSKVMAVVNEQMRVTMEKDRITKGLPEGQYDTSIIASALLAETARSSDPTYLNYKPWTDMVSLAKGSTPAVLDEKTGTYTLSETWKPVASNLLNIWNSTPDKAVARANILKVTGDSEVTDMFVQAAEAQSNTTTFSESLAKVFDTKYNPENMKGTGPKLPALTDKDMKAARNALSSAAPGLFGRALDAIGVGSPADSYQGATSDLVLARAVQRWHESNVRALKPVPFQEFLTKTYIPKELDKEFVYDGANYVRLPPGYQGTTDPKERDAITTVFSTLRRKVERELKRADVDYSTVSLAPVKEGSAWYEVYVDGKPYGFQPIAVGDAVRVVGGKTVETHGLLKTHLQAMRNAQVQAGDMVRQSGLPSIPGQALRWAGEWSNARDAVKQLETDVEALKLGTKKVEESIGPVIQSMKLPIGLTASVSVGDSGAQIKDTVYRDPTLAMAMALESAKSSNGLLVTTIDNNGGVTLPFGINMKFQDEGLIRQHMRSIGIADKESQDRILEGKTGMTQSQAIGLYKLVVPRYEKEAADMVTKMTGLDWAHLTPNVRAAITQAHYNGVGEHFIKSVMVDKKPDSFKVFYTDRDGKKVHNTRMENGIKAMFAGTTDFLALIGQLPRVSVPDVKSPLNLPKLEGPNGSSVITRTQGGRAEVQLPNGQWVPPPPTGMSLPPLPKN